MARWTDETEYPTVASVQPADRLMLYRPGVGQRQVTGANLPSGGGGGHADVQVGYRGKPTPGEIDTYLFLRDTLLDFSGAFGQVIEDPTSTSVFTLYRVPGSMLGTVSVSTSGEVTFNLSGAEEFQAYSELRVVAPSPADPTLETLVLAIPGTVIEYGS